MKARILVWLVALFCCHNASFAQKEFVNASARLSGHPRILLQKGEEKALKKRSALLVWSICRRTKLGGKKVQLVENRPFLRGGCALEEVFPRCHGFHA